MAALAASRILAGVSKSGSPAPRPITSRPAALRARAFWVAAMVADGLIRPRASDRNGMGLATPRAQTEQGKRRAHLTSATAPAQCSIPSGFRPVLPGIAAAGRLSGQRGTGATVNLRRVGQIGRAHV